jgi:hypothetical protein
MFRAALEALGLVQPLPQVIIARRPRWTLEEALTFLKLLEEDVSARGWHVGVTGSVLFTGKSGKDLDVILYPHDRSQHPDKDAVREALVALDCRRMFTRDQVLAHWQSKGSTDTKYVETWSYRGRRRIQKFDVFFLT